VSASDAVIRGLAVKHTDALCFSPSLSALPACLPAFLSLSPSPLHHCQPVNTQFSVSFTRIYKTPSLPSLFSFHATNTMDTADLEVMRCPPFDPAADVRITHTVQQSRATGGDGDHHSRGVILNHYLRGPSVGKGQHGTVYKCWDLAQNSVEVVRLSSSMSFHLSFRLSPPTLHATPPTSCVPDGCLYITLPCLLLLLGHQSRVAPQSPCRPPQPAQEKADPAVGAAPTRH
jgi:hypothetical protein